MYHKGYRGHWTPWTFGQPGADWVTRALAPSSNLEQSYFIPAWPTDTIIFCKYHGMNLAIHTNPVPCASHRGYKSSQDQINNTCCAIICMLALPFSGFSFGKQNLHANKEAELWGVYIDVLLGNKKDIVYIFMSQCKMPCYICTIPLWPIRK